MNSETKNCSVCKKTFVLTAEEAVMYEQAGIPPVDQCLDCNWANLLSFWTIGRFRTGKSAFSGKQIITMLPETVQFPIYEKEEFISDAWDPLSYGQAYDPSRPFLDQLAELQKKVPHPHQAGSKNVDCEWTDDWWESKNCYLCRSGYRDEDLCYGYRVAWSKNSVDIVYTFEVDQCYDCLYCFKCYKLKYSFNCRDCVEGDFLYDCRNVQNSFMCWNLRNKQYCILNQQYTKEEYFEKLKQFNLRSYAEVQKLKAEFWNHVRADAVHRADLNVQVFNSTGNFLVEDKNCVDCGFFEMSENCRRILRGFKAKDSIEGISTALTEKSTRTVLDQFSYGNTCVLCTTNCRYSFYLDTCEDCEYCFGSIGLRKKKYCILNKQYTEEEYNQLVSRIKADMQARGEWGKFLPSGMAYGGYNISLANFMYPKSKEAVLSLGGRWEEVGVPKYEGAISSDKLPDSIDGVSDDITKQRLICVESKLSYNISPRELVFYRQYGIPLPQRHFDVRVFNLYKPMALMFRPQKGSCNYCNKAVDHYYDPSLDFRKIACVECYQQNVS